MAELAFWRCGHLLLAGPGGWCCRGGLRRRCGPGSRAGGALSADGCRFVGRGQCPAEWWGLRVDLRCLRAAVDRGGGVSIAGRVELGHGAIGEVAAFAGLPLVVHVGQVVRIVRVRFAAEEPLALLRNWLAATAGVAGA